MKCHTPIQAALEKKYRHDAVDMGCSSCHADHRQVGEKVEKTPHYLNSKQPDLCLTCHEAGDAKLAEAHRKQPWETSTCTGCHDPHASDAPKLMPPVAHGPFGARKCESCHQTAQDGKVRLTAPTSRDLCFGCHEETRNRFQNAAFKHSLLVTEPNSCVDCHDSHVAARPHALRKPVNALCAGCHATVAGGKKFVHPPVAASCTACHDAHASGFAKELHAQGNDLCLECHGENAVKLMQESGPMKLFGGRATLPPKTFEELRYLTLSRDHSRGHPFPNHPVQAAAKDGKPEINCLTCHTPHASDAGPRLFVTDTPSSTELCVRCHK